MRMAGNRILAANSSSRDLVESHIHLDKSCILDRCKSRQGTLAEAIAEVAAAKRGFTEEDVYRRARRTLEKSILQGTMRMRSHVEVDPRSALTAFARSGGCSRTTAGRSTWKSACFRRKDC